MFWLFWRDFMLGGESPYQKRETSYKYSRSYKNKSSNDNLSSFGNDVFLLLDKSLNCLEVSGNWQRISGLSTEETLGEGLQCQIAPDHLYQLALYLNQPEEKILIQMKFADHNWHWCELQLIESSGDVYRCLLRDKTELVNAKAQLERATLDADLANRSRSEFLANMSHELRTPLNAILGFSQMINSGTYGDVGHPKYNDYIDNIQESGHTLLSRVNDLIEIANIDSGKMKLNEAEHDIIQIINQSIEFHLHRAFADQVQIKSYLPKEQVLVMVDRVRMLQVMNNVISNAIRFNKADGVVEISCKIGKDGGINICVSDNGNGIAAKHLQNILSAFGQDNSFFARSRDCVGLGLALAKEMVKLHKGKIDIESEQGVGTWLTICLPKERRIKKTNAQFVKLESCLAS